MHKLEPALAQWVLRTPSVAACLGVISAEKSLEAVRVQRFIDSLTYRALVSCSLGRSSAMRGCGWEPVCLQWYLASGPWAPFCGYQAIETSVTAPEASHMATQSGSIALTKAIGICSARGWGWGRVTLQWEILRQSSGEPLGPDPWGM